MRKRKTPEPDPLDPRQYHPNLKHLRDCAWMAIGMDFPSLSFMATLVWARRQEEIMDAEASLDEEEMPAKQRGLYRDVVPPLSLSSDVFTYLAWSLGQYIQFPSGAKVLVSLYESKGSVADRIGWEISFPETMGGKYERIEIDYDILRSGLYETKYTKTPRRHGLYLSKGICHIDGAAQPALAKRGRWYAPNPHQITETSAPPMAKKLLRDMWERKKTGPYCRNLHSICFYYVRGTKDSGIRHHTRQLFGVLLWLFLKGYITMIRGTNFAVYGPVFSYRKTRRRHKDIITDYSQVPCRMLTTIEYCLGHENFLKIFYDQLTDYWDRTLPKKEPWQTHVIQRSQIHKITKAMHDPLVIDVILDIIAADRRDENSLKYFSPEAKQFLYNCA